MLMLKCKLCERAILLQTLQIWMQLAMTMTLTQHTLNQVDENQMLKGTNLQH